MDALLTDKGVTTEQLNRRLLADHRNTIAMEIGKDWESLAAFIGVPPQDVHDITEMYPPENPNVSPRDKRLALLRRWEELYGSGATYLKLILGLEQIGRRDLSELLIALSLTSGKHCHQEEHGSFACLSTGIGKWSGRIRKSIWFARVLTVVVMAIVVAVFVGVANYIFRDYNPVIPKNYESTYKGLHNETLLDSNDLIHLTSFFSADQNSTPCNSDELPESDLPILYGPFVGREHDLREVAQKTHKVHIVNINGAPGFGKSFLSIHTGYEIITTGIPVRYINIEDKLAHFQRAMETKKNSRFNKDDYDFSAEPVWFKTTTAVTKATKFTLTVLSNSEGGSESDRLPLMEELIKWSQGIMCTTVLILDNCDSVLSSSVRNDFFNHVDLLIQHSQHNLHIILVSQEKLVLLDRFDTWTVRELAKNASIELLQNLAPGIVYKQADIVSELVGRCPLALKVVGHLLHKYGDQLTESLEEELEQNPIDVLDQASVHKHQFRMIMNVVFKRLEELKECGYAVSLFPGSFSWQAGMAILSKSPKRCLNSFTKHSLLDEYLHGHHQRFRMHRLIKEYFLQKVSDLAKREFQEKFHLYYELFLLGFATNSTIVDEPEWHVLSLEEHNLLLYLQHLLSKHDSSLSVDQLIILGFSLSQKWISSNTLQNYSKQFIENLKDVCSRLGPVNCGGLYSIIVPQLHQECRCESFNDYIQNVFKCPCLKIFSCEIAYKLNRTESIWVQLSEPEKSFVERLIRYNCYENRDVVLSLGMMSSFILSIIATFTPTIRKLYYVMIFFFILVLEDNLRLFLTETEKMVFIEIIPRNVICHIIPLVTVFVITMLIVWCNQRDNERQGRNFYKLFLLIGMVLALYVSLYFFYPKSRYVNTKFCPLLPFCY